jgi:hypothetical protein
MRRTYLFWGVILIILSGLILLRAFGAVSINLLDYFWQIFLIILGVWIIINSTWKPKSNHKLSIDLQNASQARINISHGAGRVNIKSGALPNELLSCTSNSSIFHTETLSGSTLKVSIKPETNVIPFMSIPEGLNWDLNLSNTTPLSLVFETGASQTVADLSDLLVTNLKISTGASTMSLILPSKLAKCQVTISAGAATLGLCVPPNVAASIRMKDGLSNFNIDTDRFIRMNGNSYQSQDYNQSSNQAEITIEAGVGSITIH